MLKAAIKILSHFLSAVVVAILPQLMCCNKKLWEDNIQVTSTDIVNVLRWEYILMVATVKIVLTMLTMKLLIKKRR